MRIALVDITGLWSTWLAPVETKSGEVAVLMGTPSAKRARTERWHGKPATDRPQPALFTVSSFRAASVSARRARRRVIPFASLEEEAAVGTWKTILVGVDGSR